MLQRLSAVYRGLNVPAEAATEFEAVAALAYDFRANTPTVEVGGEVDYELTVRNAGAAPATRGGGFPAGLMRRPALVEMSHHGFSRPSQARATRECVRSPRRAGHGQRARAESSCRASWRS